MENWNVYYINFGQDPSRHMTLERRFYDVVLLS